MKLDQATQESDEDLSRCNSCNLTAASPFGSDVRPHSISLTEEGAKPTLAPISAKVIPFARRSEIRDAQVFMQHTIRPAVISSQRLAVTEFRQNWNVTRPPDLPRFRHAGARVRYWRKKLDMSQKELAARAGYSQSALSDLENERSEGSDRFDVLASILGVSAHYLRTDEWIDPDTDQMSQRAPAQPVTWPFTLIPPERIASLDLIEREWLESYLIERLAKIETERRKAKKRG